MSDRVFRGRKEVVVLDGEADFRPLPGRGGTELYLHGSPIGDAPESLAGRAGFADVFGRFIVLVHDPRARTLAVRGDRYGFVPFYGARSGDRISLSLRIASLVRRGAAAPRLDEAALSELLALQLALGGRTIVEGVSSFRAGTATTIHLDTLEATTTREWDAADLLRGPRVALDGVREELVDLFLEANERCVADAEQVAVTLSGGMDTRCLLAAVLKLGKPVCAYNVSVPGSRAGSYARRIAERCGIPLHAHRLDEAFARRYHPLVEEVVRLSEGMKFVPQPEMLWLRDLVTGPAVVLHGAFGEIAKLGVLRDYRLDPVVARADPACLADVLWRLRFEPRFRRALRIFDPAFRERLQGFALANLRAAAASLDADLGVPERLQVLYFREWVPSARYAHQIWNRRLPTRFPFIEPRFVDLLLRVRTEDRMEQRFQMHFLARIHPELHRLPDENTGASASASRVRVGLVRLADLARRALFDSPVEAGHGDRVGWLSHMEPRLEDVLADARSEPIYDHARLEEMARSLRSAQARRGPRRGLAMRRARAEAEALQTFLVVEACRRWLRGLGTG